MKNLILSLLFISAFANAAELYPPPPHVRPFGMHQASTGSCMSEAEVFSLENAFQIRGYAVKLSTYHAHAFNWQDDPDSSQVNQSYRVEDKSIFNHFGRFVPAYFYPEDGRGFKNGTRKRPAVSEFGVYDFSFPSYAGTQQTTRYHYLNQVSIDHIKNLLNSKTAITLSLQGAEISPLNYNINTGLRSSSYQRHSFSQDKSVNHAVALVGYDDSLYGGKGAFIIRNSWNENYTVYSAASMFGGLQVRLDQISDKEAFQSFRAKINPTKNEIGYFAIPYEYITYMAQNGQGGIKVFGINYETFAQNYETFERRYKVTAVPFYCDKNLMKDFLTNRYPKLLEDARGIDVEKKKKAIMILTKIFSPLVMTNAYDNNIKMALVSTNTSSGQSRIQEFLGGKWKEFYCDNAAASFGPDTDVLSHPEFDLITDRLTLDPYGLGTSLSLYRMFYEYLGE